MIQFIFVLSSPLKSNQTSHFHEPKDKPSNTTTKNTNKHELEPLKFHSFKSSKCAHKPSSLILPTKIQRAEASNKFCHTKFFENSAYQTLRIKRNRKAARMLGFLVAAFSICWLPYCVSFPLSQFYPDLGKLNTLTLFFAFHFYSVNCIHSSSLLLDGCHLVAGLYELCYKPVPLRLQ